MYLVIDAGGSQVNQDIIMIEGKTEESNSDEKIDYLNQKFLLLFKIKKNLL